MSIRHTGWWKSTLHFRIHLRLQNFIFTFCNDNQKCILNRIKKAVLNRIVSPCMFWGRTVNKPLRIVCESWKLDFISLFNRLLAFVKVVDLEIQFLIFKQILHIYPHIFFIWKWNLLGDESWEKEDGIRTTAERSAFIEMMSSFMVYNMGQINGHSHFLLKGKNWIVL